MSLFEISPESGLVPFRELKGDDIYESEIEDLFWENPESFLGEPVFKVARQAVLPTGGRADAVVIDKDARVVVVEIKRGIDRGQLAQCLEYAGWARRTNLDELASLYKAGVEEFFQDWGEFTESDSPRLVSPAPRLALLAHGFEGRTESALEYLAENGVPILWVPLTVYSDATDRQFIDIQNDVEPALPLATAEGSSAGSRQRRDVLLEGHRVTIGDLLDARLLGVGEELAWDLPRLGKRITAHVEDNGALLLGGGESFASPSAAAGAARGGAGSFDGWRVWRADAGRGALLDELRDQLLLSHGADSET